ncbi:hypothetical protein BDV97DRAFT_402803 [Delphinella strobiligena]|nr:hypothetical protein BDV97DRAFT_402803 [Delphinella strobiligena]
MESPLARSPFKAQGGFPLTPSQSAPDINRSVTDLVGRFNTLAVKDVDEEKTARQLKRLEAALRRAEIAREEAETEAKHLRHELKDIKEVGEEWVEEKRALKGRCEEFEKKYEKAKVHFRTQRGKHDEITRKAQKEFLEREKQHWRDRTAIEEELEWERQLRVDAHELVAFMEIERHFIMRSARPRVQRKSSVVRADSAIDHRLTETEKTEQEETATEPIQATITSDAERVASPEDIDHQHEDAAHGHQEASQQPLQELPEQTSEGPAITKPEPTPAEDPQQDQDTSMTLQDENTPEPDIILPLSPPKKQTLTVPINFGDDEEDDQPSQAESDKENSAPPAKSFSTPARPASALATCDRTPSTISTSTAKTPSSAHSHNRSRSDTKNSTNVNSATATVPRPGEWNIPGVLASADLDRAAALAMIRERRGRARSFMQGVSGNALQTPAKKDTHASQTPKTEKPQGSRRDLSAPVMGSMSAGRPQSRAR